MMGDANSVQEERARPRALRAPAFEEASVSMDGTSGAEVPNEAEYRNVGSLATLPAGSRERRVALAVIVLSALAFVVAIPFARVPLAKVPAFIPSYESALAIIDLITAIMLFGQFNRTRSPALLALASGYLFNMLTIIPHALTFPGLFSPTGLLGAGPQTTAWLYMFWHGGFPIFVMTYAVLNEREGKRDHPRHDGEPAWHTVVSILAIFAVVCALTLLATSGGGLLPGIMEGDGYTPTMKFVISLVWGLSLAALFVLWRKKPHSIINLWLMIVMCAWLYDIALSAVLNAGRFDLGFYAGRAYGLLAASFVLAALLLETNGLHGRLARAKAQLEDHARMLGKRVRERTLELARSNESLKAEIAERKQAEAQFLQAQKMEALGQLTGGLAHDFNNLLGIIIGNLDFLQDMLKENPEASELLREAVDASLRGAELNRHLLAFARRQPLQPKRVEINNLVADMTKLLSRTLGEGIEITLLTKADLWPVVVDPAQLEAALTNLCVNARDAMPRGGRLTISTSNTYLDADYAAENPEVSPGEYALLEVTDAGSGMSPEVLSRVFEPFFTTKATGKGTGLGLSMVFGFVKQSGGHVKIYSEAGVGTAVRIYLPRANQSDDAAASAEPTGSPPVAVGREVVLVVEDNEKLRHVLVKQLENLGYAVLVAEDGPRALEILRGDHEIDLLLTDVVMPGGLNGSELAEAAVQMRPGLKVLFTSGFPQAAFGPGGLLTQRDLLLSKPYRKQELAQKVRDALAA
jgi:signal transduction histidine kinase/CheY-like chemotaxis protein